MPEYKTIEELDLAGKRVLVRLDLNVTVEKGKIRDYKRIDATLKTIRYVVDNGGRAILCSHLGRPEGKKAPEFSLKPVAIALSERLGIEVTMAPDCIGEGVEAIVNSMANGSVVLLENLRFYPGEEANSPEFVEQLARLADVYINDAFGTAHRAHASTYGVSLKLLEEGKEAAAGYLMDEELRIWKPVLEAKGEGVAVVGGAKLEEKMKAVKKLAKAYNIIVGGVVANAFMKAAGYEIGDSKYTEKGKDYTAAAKETLDKYSSRIILPSQVMLAKTDFMKMGPADPKKGIPKGLMAVDIILSEEQKKYIKNAAKIVWFGPVGAYEKGFPEGSLAIVKAINESRGIAVVGGGDLAAAAEGIRAKISTGGGASIQYMTTGKLEALEALKGNRVE